MRLLHEDEHTFQVEGPNGAYRIAKAGLSPPMMERIRGFAQGGEVEPEEAVDAPWEFSRTPVAHAGRGVMSGVRALKEPAKQYFTKAAPRIADAVVATSPLGPGYKAGKFLFGSQLGSPSQAPATLPPEESQSLPPEQLQSHQPAEPETEALPDEGWDPAALQEFGDSLVAGEEPPPSPTPLSMGAGVSSIPRAQPPGAVPEGDPEWLQESLVATDRLVDAHEAAGRPVEATDEIRAAQEAERRQEEVVQAKQQEADEAHEALANHPDIDPNRYWRDQNVAQKVGVTIGLLLSGIGSGILRKPNGAARVVQAAIDRDVAAQRDDLGKAQTFYSTALEQLGSERAALLEARANTRELWAAEAGRRAKADQAAIGSAQVGLMAAEQRRIAGQERREAVRIAYEDAQRREQMDLQRHQLGLQERQIRLGEQQHAAAQQRTQSVDRVVDAVVEQGPVDGRVRGLLLADPRYSDRVISLPDGRVTIAASKESAKELREDQTTYEELTAALDRYEELARKHPSGWQAGALSHKDKNVAKGLFELIAVRVASMNEKGVLTDQDMERYKRIVPNITDSSLVFNSKLERLSALRQGLAEGMTAKVNNHSIGARQPMPGGTVTVRRLSDGATLDLPAEEAAPYLSNSGYQRVN